MSAVGTRDPHAIKAMPPAELVEEFRPFVGSIVNKLRQRLRIRVSVEDLEAYAYEGLLEAQNRFDPDEPTLFATYAYYRIRGSVLDGCRREGWLSRDRLQQERRVRATDEVLESTGRTEQASPRAASFAEAVDRVATVVDAAATVLLLNDTDMDRVHNEEPQQHRKLERRANVELVRKAFKHLTDEEREVITRHHFEGERMDEIATSFGRSRSWVSRVNTRALQKMKNTILNME